MSIKFQHKVVCITGGARGIGKETARLLLQQGAHVWIGDIDFEAAQHTADALGHNVFAHALDVTDPESFKAFLAAPNRPIDMLINNAGVMHTGAFHEIPLNTHLRELSIDLSGVMIGMHLVLPQMLERNQGHIVNVASMAGKFTIPGVATYNAAKFGVVALSRSIRNEIKHTQVSITTVLPSAVNTELLSGISTKWIPTSSAEEIAQAIIASYHHHQPEVSIPRWANSIGVIEQLFPEFLFDGIKRLVAGKRLLSGVNQQLRQHYANRQH